MYFIDFYDYFLGHFGLFFMLLSSNSYYVVSYECNE